MVDCSKIQTHKFRFEIPLLLHSSPVEIISSWKVTIDILLLSSLSDEELSFFIRFSIKTLRYFINNVRLSRFKNYLRFLDATLILLSIRN